jgi:imidazolonepropionase-like amidohydrolase
VHRIEAELMIPGQGEPVRYAAVILHGPTISYAGPAAAAPATPDATVTRATTVMPGLWDCHVHLLGVRSLDLSLVPHAAGAVLSTTGGHGDLHGYPLPWVAEVGDFRLADVLAQPARITGVWRAGRRVKG